MQYFSHAKDIANHHVMPRFLQVANLISLYSIYFLIMVADTQKKLPISRP